MKDTIFSQLDFGPITEFLNDDNITDISYSNGGNVWLKTLDKGIYMVNRPEINNALMEKLAFQCSNVMGTTFNMAHPFLDAESTELRLNFVHESIATNGIACVIRKTPAKIRLNKNKLLSEKVYEQAIGFMRVEGGSNIFDTTDIHPESYDIAKKVMEILNINADEIGKCSDKLKDINAKNLASELGTDEYTIDTILKSFAKAHRDPRDEMEKPILKSDILEIKDLKINDKLEGTVRNVVDFGAFVDIGLHNDGLIHISKMSKNYIKHPSEVLKVGDIISVYVIGIDKEKEKVQLSLFKED